MSTERQADFYEAEPPQASRELAKLRASSDYQAPFEIVRRRVIDDVYDGKMTVDATLIIRIGDVEETEAASGAQTAKYVPATPSCTWRCAPSTRWA